MKQIELQLLQMAQAHEMCLMNKIIELDQKLQTVSLKLSIGQISNLQNQFLLNKGFLQEYLNHSVNKLQRFEPTTYMKKLDLKINDSTTSIQFDSIFVEDKLKLNEFKRNFINQTIKQEIQQLKLKKSTNKNQINSLKNYIELLIIENNQLRQQLSHLME